MNELIEIIPLAKLVLVLIPVIIVIWVLHKWSLNYRNALYAVSRMLVQLMIVGYFLLFIFEAKNFWIVILVMAVMVFAASWIAIRTMQYKNINKYLKEYCLRLLHLLLAVRITLM